MPRPNVLVPLSAERRAMAGDPRAVRMAFVHARRHARKVPRLLADFESAALWGLVDAARLFDPSKGVKFITYAARRVIGAIADVARESGLKGFKRRPGAAPRVHSARHAPGNRYGPEYAGGEGDQGNRGYGEWIESGDEPVGWEVEAQDDVRDIARGLDRRQRFVVLRLYLVAGRTMKQVGLELGVSEARVSQIHAAAVAELRRTAGRDTT